MCSRLSRPRVSSLANGRVDGRVQPRRRAAAPPLFRVLCRAAAPLQRDCRVPVHCGGPVQTFGVVVRSRLTEATNA